MSTPVRPHDDFLVFGAPVIGEAEIDEVVDSLRSGWLGTGPKVARFEEDFRQYKSAEFAVAVGSCTAALHLSMLAVGLAPGDEVITTPMTFCATVNAIIHAGATPVLADVDPVSMNIDPAAIEAAITERTRAVLIVHFAGRSCDMDGICQLCQRHSLTLIEDCAHAIETTWHGQPAGTFGGLGCFSFYVTKNVCTGEGGMILTTNEAYAARLKTLALHGMTKDAWKRFSDEGYRHYYVAEAGFKYNMMDIQAALGIHQLKRIEENWQRRQLIWTRYQEALADVPVTRPAAFEAGTRHACHLYTLSIDEAAAGISRDAFLDGMTAENIGIGVHYLSILEHPYYQERFSWHPEACPAARRIGRQTVSLPLSAALSDVDVDDVITATRKVLGAG
ncbi:MAG: DegT/DnrJ/EryC1/StrS family aminotransferase [Lentisphaeria bacterium]|nr:DegT/DnrJ/EryC1/StrS family aminotransferase [Lentisphaeria bacterium]